MAGPTVTENRKLQWFFVTGGCPDDNLETIKLVLYFGANDYKVGIMATLSF